MAQNEFLYAYSSLAIVFCLLVVIIFAGELGFHLGHFVQRRTDSEIKALTGSIQGSILGLLALLLGFTFSMSMQRYDNRSMAMIEEANAIGTTILRVELLPATHKSVMDSLLQEYVALRIASGTLDMSQEAERREHQVKVTQLQNRMWAQAVEAAQEDPRPVTTGAFIQSLNGLIDSQGKRSALLQMHVPEVVLILLFLVFVSSGGMLGYSSGLTGSRVMMPLALISLLITLIVFIIVDLDRPRRGIIQVDQAPMRALLVEPV